MSRPAGGSAAVPTAAPHTRGRSAAVTRRGRGGTRIATAARAAAVLDCPLGCPPFRRLCAPSRRQPLPPPASFLDHLPRSDTDTDTDTQAHTHTHFYFFQVSLFFLDFRRLSATNRSARASRRATSSAPRSSFPIRSNRTWSQSSSSRPSSHSISLSSSSRSCTERHDTRTSNPPSTGR